MKEVLNYTSEANCKRYLSTWDRLNLCDTPSNMGKSGRERGKGEEEREREGRKKGERKRRRDRGWGGRDCYGSKPEGQLPRAASDSPVDSDANRCQQHIWGFRQLKTSTFTNTNVKKKLSVLKEVKYVPNF